jgi:hypothetical protein
MKEKHLTTNQEFRSQTTRIPSLARAKQKTTLNNKVISK